MHVSIILVAASAALAYATPAEKRSTREPGQVDITLPPGCTKKDLALCAIHLIGTTASCGAAIIEIGLDPAADLACIGSASGTAANFDECKSCIPKKTEAEQDVKRETREAMLAEKRSTREPGQVDITLPPGCTKKDLISCALHLIGTTASCGAAVIEGGLNVAADLSCVAAAGSTADHFSECKDCVPKKTNAN